MEKSCVVNEEMDDKEDKNSQREEGEESSLDIEVVILKLCSRFPRQNQASPALLFSLAKIFLYFRGFDFDSAHSRLETYIQWREELFGEFAEQEKLEHHHKTVEQVKTGFLRVLPEKLPDGQAIAYLELKRHDTSLYSATDTIRAWHHVLMSTLMSEPELAQHGFVLISNMNEVGLFNIDTAIPKAIASALSNCMPLRVANAFAINPPWVVRFVVPMLKLLLSQKLGQRLNMISDHSQLQSEFNLPATHLPTTLGGFVSLEENNTLR